ncbi:MAG TPA: hypothetical protein VEF89_27135 [Solirubrobacteraceae bacterium]|nr:hypothetical protein [Solirubrobacteraceae bacterium]
MLKLVSRMARGEHHPDRLRQQAAGNKRQRQRRGPIQPLCVIDDTEQRTLVSRLGQKIEHSETDQKPIRCGPDAQAERDLNGITLRSGQPLEAVERRPTQLLETGKRQLHVRFNADGSDHRAVRRRLDEVLKQRRLPDPSLAP